MRAGVPVAMLIGAMWQGGLRAEIKNTGGRLAFLAPCCHRFVGIPSPSLSCIWFLGAKWSEQKERAQGVAAGTQGLSLHPVRSVSASCQHGTTTATRSILLPPSGPTATIQSHRCHLVLPPLGLTRPPPHRPAHPEPRAPMSGSAQVCLIAGTFCWPSCHCHCQ